MLPGWQRVAKLRILCWGYAPQARQKNRGLDRFQLAVRRRVNSWGKLIFTHVGQGASPETSIPLLRG
eukprot:4483067-Pyramimonas_sp.AAC.1